MTHHQFRDEHGITWEAWEVVPSSAERRQGERRKRQTHEFRQIPLGSAERRRTGDRRRAESAEPRAPISPEFARGWVVFRSPAESRRLAPIPERWESLGEGELRALCARAAASGRPRRLIE